MLQLFDSIRKRKARIAVMIVAALVCSLLGGFTAAPMAKAEETGEEIYTFDRTGGGCCIFGRERCADRVGSNRNDHGLDHGSMG